MVEFKYTDRRGLEIHPDWIAERYQMSGMNRRAFESAAQAAALEPWQATAILDIYATAKQWYDRGNIQPLKFELVSADG